MHAFRIWFDYTTSRREIIVLFDSIIELLGTWHDTAALEQSLLVIALAAGLPYHRPRTNRMFVYWTRQQHIGSRGSGTHPLPLAGTEITGIDRDSWQRILRRLDARGWNDILYVESEGRSERRLHSPNRVSEEDRQIVRAGVVTLDTSRLAADRCIEIMDTLWSREMIRPLSSGDIETEADLLHNEDGDSTD